MDSPFSQYNAEYPMASEPTVLHQSQLHSPVRLETEPERSSIHTHASTVQGAQTHRSPDAGSVATHTRHQSGSKRKRSPPRRFSTRDERKKVSRACDLCKMRKVRCSGTQPCQRCASQALNCDYNAEHRRGRPVSPLPSALIDASARFTSNPASTTRSSPPRGQQTLNLRSSVPLEEPLAVYEQRKSSRSSHEPEETLYEGHYTGPTSGIAFMHRVQRRFKQDLVAMIGSQPNGKGPARSSVFSFGDGYFPDQPSAELLFPSRQKARQLVDRYFDFAMPTYRFLLRSAVEEWLEAMCDEIEKGGPDWHKLSDAKASIVLLVLATSALYGEGGMNLVRDGEGTEYEQSAMFYATAERRLSTEVGPVRLESVQARLAQCIYLLGSSRINQAWYIFGTATQMILALGLHRSRYSQSFGALTAAGSVEFDCRRRVFWSAYTLDRYLSVILGRPRIIRDEDVDQALPSSLSDTDLAKTGVSARSGQSQRVADGPIFHAKLAKIIGGISSDLYPTSGIAGANWMVAAERWTAELKAWRESLPAFLNSDKVDPAMLIPIFQRQSTVLKLAYAHALILANRQSLLSNFAELSRRQNPPPRDIAGSLKECIDAAVLVVDTVNNFIEERRMSKAFWFTHYISFCAIATLYVYTIQRSLFSASANVRGSSDLMDETHLQHFQAAEKCQRGIVETTAKNSPFRRYNIILGELQREVLLCLKKKQTSPSEASESVSGARNIGRTSQAGLLAEFPSEIPDEIQNTRGAYSLDFRTTGVSLNAQGVEVQQPQIYDQGYPPQDVGASPTGQIQVFDNIVLDMGLFGSQGEFVGWSEFDAYAINWPDAVGGVVEALAGQDQQPDLGSSIAES